MAISAGHYVALKSATELISERGTIALPMPIRSSYAVALGDNGLIALVDFSGEAWFVRPNTLRAERVTKTAVTPTTVAAAGQLVAFGYSDGSLAVINTVDNQRWDFTGHTASVMYIVIDTNSRRVISAADNEIRFWELRSPLTATTLPCTPYHIITIPHSRTLATDCSDGSALILSQGVRDARTLHVHRDLSFSIMIFRDEICTGGWDGRVLCSPLTENRTDEIMAGDERVTATAVCKDEMFVALATGAVWQIGSAAHKTRLLYKHGDMPNHMDTNDDCTTLISGAYDGSIITYDIKNQRIAYRLPRAHMGQITAIKLLDNNIYTSSTDATIKHWKLESTTGLTLQDEIRMSAPVVRMNIFKRGGWIAATQARTFVMRVPANSRTSEIRLTLNRPISALVISSDERFVALSDSDEIVILDRQNDTMATVDRPGGGISCLQFVDDSTLVACAKASILQLSLVSLNFSHHVLPEGISP